jgi:hypothetical protein
MTVTNRGKKTENQAKKIHNIKNKHLSTLNNNTRNEHNTQFYTRVVSHTDITFSDAEITLLGKGLKYNLHYKHKHWINKLALEAETAINLVDLLQQNYLRQLVAIHIKKLKQKHATQNYNITNTILEWKVMKGIKDKLQTVT